MNRPGKGEEGTMDKYTKIELYFCKCPRCGRIAERQQIRLADKQPKEHKVERNHCSCGCEFDMESP